MTNRNSNGKSTNQGSPKNSSLEFSEELRAGDNNKGTEYRSKKGSKSENKRQS
ncbi:imidazoleglycerol-phosphate dehydratase [Bacillus tianshenii]|nr:imidazoleglycerol-phosphate dehydratase [Bacillus tianshenii]